MTARVPCRYYKGISTSIPAFELRLDIQALWVQCRMVLAQYGSKLSQRHRGKQRFVVAVLAVLHTHRQYGCWRISKGGIRLLSREGKHQIPCSYRQCLKCKWAVSARFSVVDPLVRRGENCHFLMGLLNYICAGHISSLRNGHTNLINGLRPGRFGLPQWTCRFRSLWNCMENM